MTEKQILNSIPDWPDNRYRDTATKIDRLMRALYKFMSDIDELSISKNAKKNIEDAAASTYKALLLTAIDCYAENILELDYEEYISSRALDILKRS